MTAWDRFVADPRYQALSPEDRKAKREQFFKTRVEPRLASAPPEVRASVVQKFTARTEADLYPTRTPTEFATDTIAGIDAGIDSASAGLGIAEASALDVVPALAPAAGVSRIPAALRNLVPAFGLAGAIADLGPGGAQRKREILTDATAAAQSAANKQTLKSPRAVALQQRAGSYEGLSKIPYYLQNPTQLAGMAIESAPSMAAVIGATALNPMLGAGVGAGLSAADAAASVRDELAALPDEQLAQLPGFADSVRFARGNRELALTHYAANNSKAAMAIAGGTSALVMGLGGRALNPADYILRDAAKDGASAAGRSFVGDGLAKIAPNMLRGPAYRIGNAAESAVREFAGEAIEGASVPFGVNVSLQQMGLDRSLTQGVLDGAIEEGMVGGMVGGTLAAVQRPNLPPLSPGDSLDGTNTRAGAGVRPGNGTQGAQVVTSGAVDEALGLRPALAGLLPAPGQLASERDPNADYIGSPGVMFRDEPTVIDSTARDVTGQLRLPPPAAPRAPLMLPGPGADFIAAPDGSLTPRGGANLLALPRPDVMPGTDFVAGPGGIRDNRAAPTQERAPGGLRESVRPTGVGRTDTSAPQFDMSDRPIEGDILRPNGKPFFIRDDAVATSLATPGSRVMRVRGGGFVVRPPLRQPEPEVAPAPAGAPALAPPTPEVYDRGDTAQAVKLDDGTWWTRSRQGGLKTRAWGQWEQRDSFDPSPAFGYQPVVGGAQVNIPGRGRIRIPARNAAEATPAEQAATPAPRAPGFLESLSRRGINRDEITQYDGLDSAEQKRRVGKNWLYRKSGGMSLDQAVQWAREEGYLPPADPDRPDDIGIEDFVELLRKASRGETIYRYDDIEAQRAEYERRMAPGDDQGFLDGEGLDDSGAAGFVGAPPAGGAGVADALDAETNRDGPVGDVAGFRAGPVPGSAPAPERGVGEAVPARGEDGPANAPAPAGGAGGEGAADPRTRRVAGLREAGVWVTAESLSSPTSATLNLTAANTGRRISVRADSYYDAGGRGNPAKLVAVLRDAAGKIIAAARDISTGSNGRFEWMLDEKIDGWKAVGLNERQVKQALSKGNSAENYDDSDLAFFGEPAEEAGDDEMVGLRDDFAPPDDFDSADGRVEDGEIPFSRGGQSGGGVAVGRARAALRARFGRRFDKLERAGKVVVVADKSGLPPGAKYSIGETVRGAFDPATGTSYIVASDVTEANVAGVALHEIGVHDGLASVLGKQGIAELADRLRALRESGDAADRSVVEQAEQRAANEKRKDEELVAHAVELAEQSAGRGIRQWLADLVSRVKAALFEAGWFVGADQLTVNDIRMLAQGALARVASEATASSGKTEQAYRITISDKDKKKLSMRELRVPVEIDGEVQELGGNAAKVVERALKRLNVLDTLLRCINS